MLLENDQYFMKSYHFALRSRSEPSNSNAFSPSNRKPIRRHNLYGEAHGWATKRWAEMFIPWQPMPPAVSSMFPIYHVLRMSWHDKGWAVLAWTIIKDICHLLDIKFRNMHSRVSAAAQWHGSRLFPSFCFAIICFWFLLLLFVAP